MMPGAGPWNMHMNMNGAQGSGGRGGMPQMPHQPMAMGGFPMVLPMVGPGMSVMTEAAATFSGGGGGGKKVTDGKHVITFHPPGFPLAFDVSFPPRRLPVCDRCKKNYKSRDLCRTRDGHKTLPWTKTYIVITIDKSCISNDAGGNMSYADVPMVAKLCGTPTSCSGPSDGSMIQEPICQTCRDKNYTRDYCRNTCGHTSPPWSSVYVRLQHDTSPKVSELEGRPPAKKRKKNQPEAVKTADDGSGGGKGRSSANGEECNQVKKEGDGKDKNFKMGKLDFSSFERVGEDDEPSDDLTSIHSSRTFLAAVSSKSISVRWCEDIQHPVNSSVGDGIGQMKMGNMPPNIGMDYFAQQQQGVGDSYTAHQALQTRIRKQAQLQRDGIDILQCNDNDGNTGGKSMQGWQGPQGGVFDPSNISNPMVASMMGMAGNFAQMPPNMQQNPLWDAFRAGAMWAQAQGANTGFSGIMNPQGMGNSLAFFAPHSQAADVQGWGGQGGRSEGPGGSQGSSILNHGGAMMGPGGQTQTMGGSRQTFGGRGEEKSASSGNDGGNDMFGPPIQTEKL